MRKILFFLFLIILIGGFWCLKEKRYLNFSLKIPEGLEEAKMEIIEKIEDNIFTPPLLEVEKEFSLKEINLSKERVIKLTKLQRQIHNLTPLKENSKLDQSALIKAEDILENQYFAHSSPRGEKVSDLMEKVEYDYLILGENLAMGNFENEEKLVEAWMKSPLHRENILNPKYQEIGVAILKGEFEGRETQIAVQHFATPVDVCPKPSEQILKMIRENKQRLRELKTDLVKIQTEVKESKFPPLKKISQYNSLVSQYNLLLEKTKGLINQYNLQTTKFNQCIEKFR